MSTFETSSGSSAITTGEPAFRRLSIPAKARLATEIIGAYVWVRWTLARAELPRAVATIRLVRSRRSTRLLADPASDGRRLGAAVVRTLEPLPVDTRCLMRSLVLLRLLARRGGSGSLVIAVRPNEDLSLAAHAWVELADQPLLAPATPDHARLVTL